MAASSAILKVMHPSGCGGSGGRVVEGARLESEYTAKPYRGFESLPLRHHPAGFGPQFSSRNHRDRPAFPTSGKDPKDWRSDLPQVDQLWLLLASSLAGRGTARARP